jgi:hypothetical protein
MIGDRTRVSVAVAVAPPRAFDIFTADIDQWWRRGFKFRHSASRSGLLRIEPEVGGRLAALRPDHPARHGLQGADFSRMIGLWWGEQMSSLRLLCAGARS